MLKTMKTLELFFSTLLIVLMIFYVFFELTNPMGYLTFLLGGLFFSSGGVKIIEGKRITGWLLMVLASFLVTTSFIDFFK